MYVFFLKCLSCHLFAFGSECAQEGFLWLLVELYLVFQQKAQTSFFFLSFFLFKIL